MQLQDGSTPNPSTDSISQHPSNAPPVSPHVLDFAPSHYHQHQHHHQQHPPNLHDLSLGFVYLGFGVWVRGVETADSPSTYMFRVAEGSLATIPSSSFFMYT